MVRAKTPQFAIPVIFWAIVANVTLAYAPQYSKMIEEDTLIFLLFKAFFTGFALASGVSLLIFPVNCRGIVFADIKSHLDGLRGALQANAEYLQSLETVDMFAIHDTKSGRSLEAEALESKMATLSALHAKLNGDVPFAKREIAVGKLGPDDIQECVRHLRMLMIPMAGLGAVPKIFEGVAKDRPWDRSRNLANADLNMKDARDEQEEKRVSSIQDWHHMMWLMRDPVANLTRLIIDGLEHVEIMLQLE